jgi:hypothetical protein
VKVRPFALRPALLRCRACGKQYLTDSAAVCGSWNLVITFGLWPINTIALYFWFSQEHGARRFFVSAFGAFFASVIIAAVLANATAFLMSRRR